MLSIGVFQSPAQNWVSATVASSTYSGSPSSYGVQYVSNDVDRTVNTVSGIQYNEYFSATAWDGASSAYVGWAYDDGHGHTFDGVITIPTHVGSQHTNHPDVVVIKRSSGIYYIVVASYNVNGSGVYADWFKLTLTDNLPSAPTLTWASPAYATLSSASLPASYTTYLDVSQGDKLVAVWTESVSGTLQVKAKTAKFVSNVLTWSSNTFTLPTFTFSGNNYTAPFKDADVAIFEKANGDNVATFCLMKDNTYGSLIISEDIAFSDLEAGTTFSSLAAYTVIDYTGTAGISLPRIDRQRQLNTDDQTGWTVVFSKYTVGPPSYTDICGITSFYDPNHNPTFYDNNVITYTDGTAQFWGSGSGNFLPDINNEGSFYPVVSYEKRSGDIDPSLSTVMVIAFNHYDGSNVVPLSFYAQYEGGSPYSKSSPNQQYKFYSIPYNASGDERYIAVSGTESKYFMYSWINTDSPYTIEYKFIDTKELLRIGNYSESENSDAIIFSQNYAMPFSMPAEFERLQLFSTTGNLIADKNGGDNWMDAFSKLNNGLFIARFLMIDGSAVSRKVIINK